MFILSAIGIGLSILGAAYGWWGSQKAGDAAEQAANANADAIEQNARQNEWLNHINEGRFEQQQSVALGSIKAGVSSQHMEGTAGGQAYEESSQKTASMDTFLMKYKDNADIQNLMKQAEIVRQGGQATADAYRTSGNANAISNLGNLAVQVGKADYTAPVSGGTTTGSSLYQSQMWYSPWEQDAPNVVNPSGTHWGGDLRLS